MLLTSRTLARSMRNVTTAGRMRTCLKRRLSKVASYPRSIAPKELANKDGVVTGNEKDRKAEWVGLKKMKCLVDAFGDGKVESAEITKCKNGNHTTTHLNIKYPTNKDMDKCEVPKLYPSTAEYKKTEFAPLPALAKGKTDANECTGVAEISTKPATGSPRTCKWKDF